MADWNMIYDQAMVVNVPTRGLQFIANFRYSVDPRIDPSQYHLLETGTYEAFISKCTETMVGVVMHDGDKSAIQCYIGYQERPFLNVKIEENEEFAPDL